MGKKKMKLVRRGRKAGVNRYRGDRIDPHRIHYQRAMAIIVAGYILGLSAIGFYAFRVLVAF